MRDCLPAAASVDRTSHAVAFITSDRDIDRDLIAAYIIMAQGRIYPRYRMYSELLCERFMRMIVLGYHQKSACILIDPVDYAGTYHSVYGRKRSSTVVHNGVDQRPAPVSRTRMDDHAPRLIDDKKVRIFVYYIEGDILCLHIKRLRLRHIYSDLVACLHGFFLGGDRRSVDAHASPFDQLHSIASGKLVCIVSDKGIQSASRVLCLSSQHKYILIC